MAVLCLVVSTKEAVMDENEFEYYGVVFTSKKETEGCVGCAFFDPYGCKIPPLDSIPPCSAMDRHDNESVIFVEKQQ